MAIFRLYPKQGTFITSEDVSGVYPNAGQDPILTVGTHLDSTGVLQKDRILLEFDQTEIQDVFQNKIETSPFKATLNLGIAQATLVKPVRVDVHNILSEWEEGAGRFDDRPITLTGADWKYRTSTGDEWTTLGGDYSSASVNSIVDGKSWNIQVDVTPLVTSSVYGFLIKTEEDSTVNLISCYGDDTHTIYPPYLEFGWDDSIYTGSLETLLEDVSIKIKNNRGKYTTSDIVKFDLSVRSKYPVRTFTTSSIYLTNYRLPENSFWGIKDEYSCEMVVPFGEYTKISADEGGNYFIVNMSMLQPERYYRLMIRTDLGEEILTIGDRSNLIKVVRNG